MLALCGLIKCALVLSSCILPSVLPVTCHLSVIFSNSPGISFPGKKETQSLFATNISSLSGLFFLPKFSINNYITLYTDQCVYVECMSTPYVLEVTYLTAILMNDKTTIMIKSSTSCTILFFN